MAFTHRLILKIKTFVTSDERYFKYVSFAQNIHLNFYVLPHRFSPLFWQFIPPLCNLHTCKSRLGRQLLRKGTQDSNNLQLVHLFTCGVLTAPPLKNAPPARRISCMRAHPYCSAVCLPRVLWLVSHVVFFARLHAVLLYFVWFLSINCLFAIKFLVYICIKQIPSAMLRHRRGYLIFSSILLYARLLYTRSDYHEGRYPFSVAHL